MQRRGEKQARGEMRRGWERYRRGEREREGGGSVTEGNVKKNFKGFPRGCDLEFKIQAQMAVPRCIITNTEERRTQPTGTASPFTQKSEMMTWRSTTSKNR